MSLANRILPLLSLLLAPCAAALQEGAEDAAKLRAEGERALAAGEGEAALKSFEAALAAGGSIASRLGRARSLLLLGRVNDALDELDRAEKEAPEAPEVSFQFSRALLAKAEKILADRPVGARVLPLEDAARRGCFEEAARRLEALLRKDGRHASAALLLARVGLAAGEFDAAERAVAQTVAIDPKLAGLARAKGDLAFARFFAVREQGGDPEQLRAILGKARASFEEAMREDPRDAGAAKLLGDVHLWREKREEAAAAYGEALARDPASVDGALLSGRLPDDLARKTFEKAAARFEEAHPGAGAAAGLWWYVGYYQFRAEEWKAARASFAKALLRNPAFTNAHYYAAKAAYVEKDYDAAEASFVALARAGLEGFASTIRQAGAAPVDQEIVLFLANRAVREGREEVARDLFRATAELAPDDADHWNNAAFFARQTGKAEDSYAWYRRALEARPDDPQLLNATAVVLDYNLRRDPEEAKRLYRRAIECAERVLASPGASEAAKREARTAKGDAENNLRRHEGSGGR